ncbi:MAG: hypothetical protein COA97_11945 [Flavobacteriales bacterium]|nr:MAG: hypothetical protein COA97_11945 [Flavobacteriales bacterium]
MKYLLFLFLFSPLISFAQKEEVVSHKRKDIKEARVEAKIKAKEQVLQLHDGVLLVRLSTRKKSLAAMRKANKNKLADKTENKLRIKNQKIVNAFRVNFNFCPVYFFYSDYSKYVRNSQLDNVMFLNDSLQLDSTIKVSSNKYLTAELGITEPDTKKYGSTTGFESGEKTTTYYGGPEITVTGLIIKDEQFEQLRKPFPYYVREFSGLPFYRAIHKMVLIMNNNLQKFYSR